MLVKSIVAAFATLACLAAQTPSQKKPGDAKRDLKVEKEGDLTSTKPPGPPAGSVKPAPAIPRSYAVVIGISNYQNLSSNQQLHFAEADAELIYSILISPEGGNFRAENVHKLIGAKATRANMQKEIEQWLPSVVKNDDRVLIYFAGHGFIFPPSGNGAGYLAPYDMVLDKADSTGYPMEVLGRTVGQLKAKWKVLLTDSCHSGAISPETSAQVNAKLLSLDQSLFSLTASRDREISYEGKDWGGGHGIFTYYVWQGLSGAADENGDGIVSADELADYVRRNVREQSGGKQNPTSDKGSFDTNMLLAYNPTSAKPGEAPAPKEGTLIFESNMDGVELFVDDKSSGILKKDEGYRLSGLTPGSHTIKAVKMGYEPDGPREEMVYPGQESTVKIKIFILRRRSKASEDAFDKGIQYYTKGFEQNYRKAAEQFEKALEIDPKYSQAALYLGRAENALFEEQKASAAFQKALEIDPDYLEAHWSYAGMLLDNNDTDKAVRELNYVVQRDPNNTQALYLLAEAYRLKEAYPQSIEAARKVISVTPNNAEAHFWLAESLRMSQQYPEAMSEYHEYLRLSNFDSKLAGKLNYYVLGYLVGMGRKTHASQQDIWGDLRSLAYFGICNCNYKLKRYDGALEDCVRSLSYDPKDPYVHYVMGLAYAQKFNQTNSPELAAAAVKHFRAMLAINDQMSEAGNVKKMLANFEAQLSRQ
ncbi:MAG: caspase family protein [Acidobacteriaceae bacterium]|nr:caspase family protein [Acidobacteriaceae bacterium]